MALDAFLDFYGNIKGSTTQTGRAGKVAVLGIDHKVEVLADSVAGVPSTTVLTGAMVVTIPVDAAVPSLHIAMQDNKVFKEVKLEMWRMAPRGGKSVGEQQYFTIHMLDVRVKSMRLLMRFNKPQDDSLIPEVEEVTLSYRDLSLTYKSDENTSTGGPFTPNPR